MRRSSHGGLFVTFEGIDGTGKTTALSLVAEALRAEGVDPVVTKLPGDARAGSDIGEGLRLLLFSRPSTKNMAPGVADLLYLADQLQCTAKVIVPALNARRVVLCDRYADSQAAYSAHPAKGTPDWARELYARLTWLEPDLTFLLTVDPDTAGARAKSRHGEEAGKQDGKAWENGQSLIQGAYLGALRGLPRTRIIEVDELEADDVAGLAAAEILSALEARR